MNIAFNIPKPVETATYKPIGHKELVDTIENQLIEKGMFFTPKYNSKQSGQIFMATYDIGKGDFKQSLSCLNSYNKKTRVGIVTGTNTSVCDNGCLFGESKFLRKHTGNIQKELTKLIQNQINQMSDTFDKNLDWFEILKNKTLTSREMSELAGRLFIEEDLIQSNQLSILKGEINNPSFDYGGNNDTLYEFYQHITHSIKNTHPIYMFKTHRELINFTNTLVH